MSGEDNHEWFDNPELIGQSIALAGTVAEWWYSYQFTSNKDGTIFAVSDPGGNVNVKIYEYNASSNCGQGGYEQKGSTISNPTQYVKFGTNIKFNDEGTILFVSAPGDNYNYNAEIYVYEWNPSSNCGQGGWDQKGEKITAAWNSSSALICNKEGTIIAYNTGYGSSNSEEKVIVQEWNPSSNCGQGGWEQKGGNIGTGSSNDKFGNFMDMNDDGTIIVIGAYDTDDKGRIYVYEWNPSSNCGQGGWEQRGSTITNPSGDDFAEIQKVGGRVCINSDGTFIVSMFEVTNTMGGATHVFCVWEWNPSSNCGQGGWEQKGDFNYSNDRKYNDQISFLEHSDGPKISDDGMYIFIPEYRHDTGNNKNEDPVGGGFKLYTWDQTSNCGQGDWGIVSQFSIDDDPYFCRFTTLSNDGTVVGTWSNNDVKFYKLAEPRSTGEDELGDWGATINLAQVISSSSDFAITGAINRHGNMFAFQDSPNDNIWIYKSTEEDSGINGGWNYTLHEKIDITGQQNPGNKLEMDWTGRNILYFNYGQEELTLYRGDSFQISETRYSTDNSEFQFPFDSTVYENKGVISGVRTFGIARLRNTDPNHSEYEMIAYITGTEVKIAEYNNSSIYNNNTFANPTTWTFESLSNPGTFETTLNIGAVSSNNKTYSGDDLERGIALSGNGEFLAVCDASVTPEIIHLFRHTGSGKWTRFKDKDGNAFVIYDQSPYTNNNSKGRFGEFLCWDRFGSTLLVSDYGANNNDSGGDGSIWIYDLEWNPTTSNGDNATANGYSGGVIKNKAVINKNYGTGGRPWGTSWASPPTLSEDGNRITFGGNYHDGDGFLAIYDRVNNDFVEVPGHNIAPDNFQSYFDNVSSDLPEESINRWGAWSVLLSDNGETIVTPMRNAKRDSNNDWVHQIIALDVSAYQAPGEGYVVGDPVITEWLDEAVQLGDALPDPTLSDDGNALTADIHTLHELSGDGKSIIVAHINLSGTGTGGGNEGGKVNVYEWDESSNCGQGGWSQKGDDISVGFYSADAFGLAINYDGSIVAVGQPNDAGGKGDTSGHFRALLWNASSNCGQGGWETQEDYIQGPDGLWFAASIALNYDGTIIAATLGKAGEGGSNDGIITYEWNASSNCGQGGWEEKGRISAEIDFYSDWLVKNPSLNMNKDGTMIAFNLGARSYIYEWNASSNCGQGGWEEKANIPDAYFPKMNDDGSIIAYILSNKGHRSVKVVEWNASANCGQGEYDLNGKGTAIDIDQDGYDCIELNNDGTILVVGEWAANDNQLKSNGVTTVYKWNASSNCGQGDWDELLTISGNATAANFGRAISLSSNGGILSFQQNINNDDLESEEAETEPIFIYKLGNEGSGGGSDDGGGGDSGGGDSGGGDSGGGDSGGGDGGDGGDDGGSGGSVYIPLDVALQLGSDIDGEAVYDTSGRSVSINGDGTIVAIGASANDGNGDDSGHVRVYQWNGTDTWTQLGQDIDGEAAGDRSGTSVSLSNDGTILAIGATDNDGTSGYFYDNRGHVRVYQYNGSDTWIQLGSDIDGEVETDKSGSIVSLSSDGTIVAIGAILNDGGGNDSGHVRVYQYANNTWTQLGQDIDGEAAGDYSGYSVSLSSDGTIVAIGAYGNDGNGSGAGHVRVYQYNGTTWTQLGEDIDGEAGEDNSGLSVSLSSDGTILAIGAPYNDGNGDKSGHVRVYQYANNTWTQLGLDIDGEAAGDYSGSSNNISLSGDGTILAIGAVANDGNADYSGHVRIYQWNGTDTWTQLGSDIDGESIYDYSGWSVSLSNDGTILAIGAPYNDGNDEDRGHVRIYKIADIGEPPPPDTGNPVITLNGSNPTNVNVGETYTELATASDNNDGDITSDIVITGSVNTSVSGSYTLTYNVKDAADNSATEVTRTVIVADTGNPVITLNGSNPTNVNVGETYTELATASDNNDGDITSDIVITGSVNTSVSGSYTLTYNVKDAADNSAIEVTRTVIVKIPGALIENLQVPTTFTIKDDYIYIFNGLTKKIVRYDMDGNLDNSNLVQLTKNATDMIFDSQNNLIVSEENGDILKIANVWKQGTPSDNSNYK